MSFIHLFDVNESKNFASRFSISWIIDVIKLLIYRRFAMGGFVYDLALIQTDREIGNFFRYLKKNKILDDSKIVITSDHGLQSGFPTRKKAMNANQIAGSDLSQQFFDEFIHVPLIFYPKTINEINENSFSSHIDFAPTVLNYCEIGSETIDYICDTTEEKINKYSPGMHIPIVPVDHFRKNMPDIAYLFAWNHKEEIFNKEIKFKQENRKWVSHVDL